MTLAPSWSWGRHFFFFFSIPPRLKLAITISNNFAEVLKVFSLVLQSLYAQAFISHKHLYFCHSAMKASLTFIYYLHSFLILIFFPYYFKQFDLFTEDISLKSNQSFFNHLCNFIFDFLILSSKI